MVRKANLNLVIMAALAVLAFNVPVFSGDANLVAHWAFDEGSGAVAYDSAGDSDGTLMGDPVWTSGQIDGALEFDGLDDYIDLGNDGSLKPSLPVTICAWVNLSGSGKHQRIVSIDEQSPARYYGFWLHILSTDRVRVGFGDGRGGGSQAYRRSKIGTTILGTDTWYHVAAVIRGATDMDVYVNGVDDGGSYEGSGSGLAYSSGSSYIGREAVWQTYLDGSIDDVRIYDRALSADEVEELYWTGIGGAGLAIFEVERALAEKESSLEVIDAALEKEMVAYDALEEALESKDYGDLKKSDIIKARQRIHSAMQHQAQSASALERGVEQLGDALEALGVEPEPEIVYEVSGCGVGPLAALKSDETQFSVVVKGSYIYFEDLVTANCCADEVELQMEVEGNLITIYEIEHATRYCLCICDYPATATLGPFEPGTYTVEVYGVYGGFIGSTTVTIGPERVKKDAKGLLKAVRTPKPKV